MVVVGGSGKSEYQASVEMWNPADGAWSPLARMVAGRSVHTASLLPDGRLFIVGAVGLNVVGGVETHRNPEIYDFETDKWHLTSEINIARSGHTLSELPAGQLFLTGGTDDLGFHTTAEIYDPSTETWTTVGEMSVARLSHQATVLDNGRVPAYGRIYRCQIAISYGNLHPVAPTSAYGCLDWR